MSLISELKQRFRPVLSKYDDAERLLQMLKPSQDAKFGDYQMNCAMSLKQQVGKPPREIAESIVAETELDDLCEKVEIAGPGFINLTLRNSFLAEQVSNGLRDSRLGIAKSEKPLTTVIDYSSPNVAKPMHVGHIRSTVIGDSLASIMKFLGHRVIKDNHLGDWGTQFGMIIYGYKHFAEPSAYQADPIPELSRIYRYVRRLMDYFEKQDEVPRLKTTLQNLQTKLEETQATEPENEKAAKKLQKSVVGLERKIDQTKNQIESIEKSLVEAQADPKFAADLETHSGISNAVLQETVKLHEGDTENVKLWNEFMPYCRDEIQRIYSRLNIEFDHEYGESHYHSMLGDIVDEFVQKGLAKESDGALCVFLDDFEAPMIIRKRDGAFLYSTTDLATIKFRMNEWDPDLVLYVVDHRQGEHFQKLFAAARKWGYDKANFFHVSFGTVMGADGKPFKTRSGDTVGLEGLLDHAVEEAGKLVREINNGRPENEKLSDQQCEDVANVIGLGGLKYFDLSHHRASNYEFSYESMLALKGDTAPYVQYSYARVHGIFRKGNYDPKSNGAGKSKLELNEAAERTLALKLLRFEEALDEVLNEFKPNVLTTYLFELSQLFASFFEQCPVLKAENEDIKNSRLQLCDFTAKTIGLGLGLLGIEVREKM